MRPQLVSGGKDIGTDLLLGPQVTSQKQSSYFSGLMTPADHKAKDI